MNIHDLERALYDAWDAETSAGNWTPFCPPVGQCAVTALVVQDYFGGALMRAEVAGGGSHYWNVLADGATVDLTFDQFEHLGVKVIFATTVERDRAAVLANPDTARRYELLASRIAESDL